MTSIKKIISALLAALFMTGLLVSAPAIAAENNCVKTDSIENLSEDEYFWRYKS